jgi:hypothetical protein
MEITKLEKEANYLIGNCKITVEITISNQDLMQFDYEGLDMIPDETIPDILTAIGRMYHGKIKKGKLLKEKVGSLLP